MYGCPFARTHTYTYTCMGIHSLTKAHKVNARMLMDNPMYNPHTELAFVRLAIAIGPAHRERPSDTVAPSRH